ncbi:MAG TPA: hypothetical protein VKE70_14370 [Candidatus Solibacter sp.]|nr:hypothetical protein [Candidatus Solibacter sp.]
MRLPLAFSPRCGWERRAVYACIPLKQEIARLRLADGSQAVA